MSTEPAGWVALAGALGGAAGAICSAMIRWRRNREKIRRSRHESRMQEWRELVEKLQLQLERQGTVITQQQTAIEALWKADGDCRTALAEARSSIHFLYDQIKRLHGELRGAGRDPGDLPHLPEIHERTPPTLEFVARQATQSAVLVSEAAKVLQSPPPVQGGT